MLLRLGEGAFGGLDTPYQPEFAILCQDYTYFQVHLHHQIVLDSRSMCHQIVPHLRYVSYVNKKPCKTSNQGYVLCLFVRPLKNPGEIVSPFRRRNQLVSQRTVPQHVRLSSSVGNASKHRESDAVRCGLA